MLRFYILFFVMVSSAAWAEYRVFELEITAYAEPEPTEAGAAIVSPSAEPKPQEEIGKRIVLSTLDPEQYRGYQTIKPNEKVRYIATWRCLGRTSNKDYCPNPKVKTESEAQSVSSESK